MEHQHTSAFDQHECNAVVLHCIDFRFWDGLYAFIKNELGIRQFDVISLAGGAKNLSSPSATHCCDTALLNGTISQKLHHISTFVLVNHVDCGAYGGSDKFENLLEEIEFHKKELTKAEAIVKEKFSGIKIVKVLVSRNGDAVEYLVV